MALPNFLNSTRNVSFPVENINLSLLFPVVITADTFLGTRFSDQRNVYLSARSHKVSGLGPTSWEKAVVNFLRKIHQK